MWPFWNHILANQADLSMCVLKSHGMSAVCTWGLRGIFFLTTCTFCALLPRCCVLLCGSHLSYVCTEQTLILLIFWGMTCVRTSDHLPSHPLEASISLCLLQPHSITPSPLLNSHLRVTKLHYFSISAHEFTSPPCHLELKRPPQMWRRSLL
jgi:hypothetical protein